MMWRTLLRNSGLQTQSVNIGLDKAKTRGSGCETQDQAPEANHRHSETRGELQVLEVNQHPHETPG